MANQELQVIFTLNDRAFKRGVKNSQKQISSFQNSLKGLSGQLATVFGTRELIRFGAEASKLAGKVDGVKRAFDTLSGTSLQALKEATSNSVTELKLMQVAVQARNFKIPLEQLAGFFEFATKRAAETGESVEYLTNSIVLGIGRKSPLILDNLGISAVELRKKLKGVGIESANTADIARSLNEIIQEQQKEFGTSGKLVEDTNVKTQQLNSAWQNLTNSFGQRSQGAYNILLDFLTKAVTKLDHLYQTSSDILAESAQGGAEGIIANIFGKTTDIEERKKALQNAINEQTEQLRIWDAELENAAKNVTKWDKLNPFDTKDEKALDNAIEKSGYYAQVVSKLQDTLDSLNDTITENTGFTEDQQKILDKVAEAQKLWNAELNTFGTRDYAGQIATLQAAIVSLIASGLSPANQEVMRLRNELSSLTSAVDAARARQQESDFETQYQMSLSGMSKGEFEGILSGGQHKAELLKNTLQEIESFGFDTYALPIENATKELSIFQQLMDSLGISIESIGMQFANTFTQMLSDGTMTFRGIVKELAAMISRMAIALAIQTALRSAMGDASAPSRVVSTLAIIGVAAGALSASIPQLANGGVATSPTLAMIGEGRESEAVLPLSKLEYMMNNSGGMQNGQIVGMLRGSDILLQYQRANKSQRRSGSINYNG